MWTDVGPEEVEIVDYHRRVLDEPAVELRAPARAAIAAGQGRRDHAAAARMTFVGMSAVEVVRVVEWLESRSAVYQINGGWAVDALHGSQTRSHGDLDLFVDATVVDDLIAWLQNAGYEIVEDWRPIRVELRRGDLAVDVHPMEIDANGDGVHRGFGDDKFIHRERERTVGVICGLTMVVACAERLRELRTGYALRAEDHHDLEVLRTLGSLRGEDC